MKSNETVKTKSESGDKEFETLQRMQEKKSARAAIAATFSRREPDSEEENAIHLVRVRAHERPGLDGIRRGGHFWTSDVDGTVCRVTPRLLQALKHEALIAVESAPDVDPDLEYETRDVPVRPRPALPDVAAVVAAGASEASLSAAYELGRAHAEIDRLRAELAASKAPAEEPKPKAKAEPAKAPAEEPKPKA